MEERSSASAGRRASEQPHTEASTSTTRSSIWRKTSDSATAAEDPLGPLGLTTVHTPLQDTIAHLIFVHGLGGGSRKTWTKDADPRLFWPREWLPHDIDFRDVKIHTFGYDSNWTKGSILDIGDFATKLLEWIMDYPEINLESETPMLFVCHSMGGLVAKQAFVLSRELEQYERVGASLHSMFFLATPHRGSDLAETLSRILYVSPGRRPFVGDLHPSSEAIQLLNDKFPRYSVKLRLHSFYETQPMQLGLKNSLVVKKESAILGYPNERATYLDADHRNVCKFESPDSTNYRAVRNALAAAVNVLRSAVGLDRRSSFPEQQQIINAALGVQDRPEDDYLRAESLKVRGSCEWITNRQAFVRWAREEPPYIYWITAKPGAGKSILCGHVLKLLRESQHECAFFFFAHGDKLKSSLSAFFRSMAWQLASTNADVLGHVSRVCKHDSQLLAADHRTIWRKLFTECIFKHRPDSPLFWVVDALDECRNDHELVPYLMQAAATGHFRIFVTSRTSFDSYRITKSPSAVHSDVINEETTSLDIELYLRENTQYLPTRDRAYTSQLILKKSDGCFLWTKLALEELKRGLTRAGIQKILDEVPAGMDKLYSRILASIFDKARERTMIIAIMEWTTCATRPLTTVELYHALRLDMNDEIDGDIKRFVDTNCGQLVMVDVYDHVRMVHLTARDFLFSPENTACRLVRADGHKRLALACLNYLTGPEMTNARPRRSSVHHTQAKQGVFVSYAATALFDHINFVHSDNDDFADHLYQFLKSPKILSWIEYLAQQSDLGRLVQAGLALRKYTARRTQGTLPFGDTGRMNALFDKWATDMVRLVTKFGSHLRASPTSIVNLIAPFCPSESAIKAQFGSSRRAIKVNGIASVSWDDCVSTIVLEWSPNAVASSPGLFALGLANGDVIVYDEAICQELKRLAHEGPVKRLLFATSESVLVATGFKNISVWSTSTWVKQWSANIESQFNSLAFADNDKLLLATCMSNEIKWWETDTGVEHPSESWVDEDAEDAFQWSRRPSCTAISADQALVAVAYRGEDVVIWDVEQAMTYDVFSAKQGSLGPTAAPRKGVETPMSMIFSKAKDEARLLVVCYNDAAMRLFDTEQGTLKASTSANGHTLASSSDGLTLACGNSGGLIQLFEFDTLRLLYCIQADQTMIKQLAFNADDQRLFGIQGRHCYVWDPPALIRQTDDEGNSDTVSVSTGPQETKLTDGAGVVSITTMTTPHSARFAICGKEDGGVGVFDVTSGLQLNEPLRHATPIMEALCHDTASFLVTVDVSSRVMLHSFASDASNAFTLGPCLLDQRIGTAVTQVLLSPDAQHLLVSTDHEVLLYSVEREAVSRAKARAPLPGRQHHRWHSHPLHSDQLILIIGDRAHLYGWSSLDPLTPATGIWLAGVPHAYLNHVAVQACFDDLYLAITYSESSRPHSHHEILFFKTASFSADCSELIPDPSFEPLASQVHALIGNTTVGTGHTQRLVFLDSRGWICSASSVASFEVEEHDQHYPLPADWLTSLTRLRATITENTGTLLFVKRGELISVSRGLEYVEGGRTRPHTKRPSLKSGSSISEETIKEDDAESLVDGKRLELTERLHRTQTSIFHGAETYGKLSEDRR